MQAVRYARYGAPEVLRVEDIAEPVPGPGEVKVRVRAASLNPLDLKCRSGELRFIPIFQRPPRGTGCDFAGDVVAVGGGAIPHFVGQRVFGSLDPFGRQGSCAEFVTVGPNRLAEIPQTVTYEAAAALPIAGGTAVQALTDDAPIGAATRLLLTGAAGGVGHYALQFAKHRGAHVTAVCSSANVEFVREAGADAVINHEHEDFTQRDATYDIVFDAAGVSDHRTCRKLLASDGVYLNTSGSFAAVTRTIAEAMVARVTSRQRAVPLVLHAGAKAWRRLAQLAADRVLVPHVARTISLAEVAAAQQAMSTGHGRGKIVVQI
jgi:NADPH:quinone reductase-like Zn-dependent oxidoreductase